MLVTYFFLIYKFSPGNVKSIKNQYFFLAYLLVLINMTYVSKEVDHIIWDDIVKTWNSRWPP